MSSNNIDERIVSMKFDNKTFEANAGTTLSTLDKLKQKLNFSDVADSAKNFNLNGVGSSIDGINAKFMAMATVGITALSNITNRAIDAGLSMMKSLAMDPITEGLKEYETNLNSIQTILANTKSKGTTLDDVNAALGELNTYSDLTIYKFSDMANAIGRFTAAGVDLKTSTAAIKGLSNVAAISGANTQQASTAMVQLSQAMASGTVRLQDWMSMENNSMASSVFQESLKETARVHKINVDKMVKDNGSFRLSLQEGWLSADIMSETLAKFTGDLSADQLKSMGYTDKQIAGILEMGKTAISAAQDVKTGTQFLDTLKESIGSGWAATWQIVFGDYEQAKKLWTGIYNAISPVLTAIANARNSPLAQIFNGWRELGGVDDLLNIITNTIKIFSNLIKPIKDAFAAVFPPSSTNVLKKITGGLSSLSNFVASATSNLTVFTTIFKAVLSVFKMAGSLVVGVVGGITMLITKLVEWVAQLPFIQKIGQAFTAVGDFVARLSGYFDKLISGDVQGFITGLSTSLSSFSTMGETARGVVAYLQSALTSLGSTLAFIRDGLGGVADMLVNGDFDGGTFGWMEDSAPVAFFLGLHDSIIAVEDDFRNFGRAADENITGKAEAAATRWQNLIDLVKGVGDFFKPGMDAVANVFKNVADKIHTFFAKASFEDILALVNTGLFMGFYMAAQNFFSNFTKLFKQVGGTFKSLTGIFNGLKNSLSAMQTELKAKALLEIAGAVALLAASVALITLLDQDKVWSAVGAIGALTAAVVGTMASLDKIAGNGSAGKILVLSAAMGLMAGAVVALAGAVIIFGNIPIDVLKQGGIAIGVTLAVLLAFTAAMSAVEKNLLSSAAALVVMATALTMLAGVIALFAAFKFETLSAGLRYMASTLGVMIAAFLLLDKVKQNMIEGAAALLIAAIAMQSLAAAVAAFALIAGKGDVLKTIVLIGASLGILAAAMYLMSGTILGAAAMLVGAIALQVLAVALAAFAVVLTTYSALGWDTIGKGLAMISISLLALSAAALVSAVPLAALGVALLLLGGGILAIGLGIALLGTGVATLAALGGAGVVAITAIIIGVAQTIPLIAQQIGLGIKAIALVIANAGPELVAALTTLLLSLLTAIDNVTPQLFATLGRFVDNLIWFLEGRSEQIFQAGLALLLYVLSGIRDNIGKVVTIAGDIIVNFIKGMDDNLQKIIDAGGDLIIHFIEGLGRKSTEILNAAVDTVSTFLDGLDDAAYKLSYKFTAVGGDIASAIIQGMANGITSGVGKVAETAKNMASKAFQAAKDFLNINSPSRKFMELGASSAEGVAVGIDKNTGLAENAATNMAQSALNAVKDTLNRLGSTVPDGMSISPVITPVLDLTNVQKSASLITGMLTPPPLAVGASIAAANDANAAAQAKAKIEAANADVATSETSLVFTQTNISPKALSEAEIYRQTKNQLSVVKEALPS